MKGFLVSLIVGPIAAYAIYFLIFGTEWLVWKLLPDSKLKRLLFQSYAGEDRGPWVWQPWQRKQAKDRTAAALRLRE